MKKFQHELSYKTSRSSGSGGQNVNKVETSVTVMWKIEDSAVFTETEKERIFFKLKNRINSEGILQFTVSESRTQLQNKKIAAEKIQEIVNLALIIPKKRIATKPSKGKIEKRLENKKKISEKKENRKFRY
ncbi:MULTISPECIES: alternative ribosome rescue aminoacyl-tRNA hydrolase ArfB [Chryseobacterium]|uniref:Peptidyl-tRNA hydrolase YaeJ n=1 Tax=Chryseobacterium taihuense TaxID=1141221 RepID=A0A4U8WC89_9FLAO|nr:MULTISPECIES: alternative ribosome rescue aminoacyl-tRNA hydrolase ArfB [Chryseobacterium]QQV03543.1 aminoacyl-tRNA hydrolase [Chryseobacterium sp. FDAARGOS 1104]VFB03126.1 Peptidyl-tRNA hydrolase YaeJ [Chryseobacterium taihuense]